MAGLRDTSDPQKSTSPERLGPRQRAPTISIDPSAITTSPPKSLSPWIPPSPTRYQQSLSIENTPLLSLDSTCTSPCSISSREGDILPNPADFLTVPGTRSRGSSLDHAHSLSSYGGETLITTPTLSDCDGSHKHSSEISFHGLENDGPSKADTGQEQRSRDEDNPFAFSSGQLSKIFNLKNFEAFYAVGGLQGLEQGLRTDCISGLSLDETALEGTVELDRVNWLTSPVIKRIRHTSPATERSANPSTHQACSERYVDRKRVFGTSRLPERKSKTLLQVMWMTFNDKVLIILTTVATISLGLGLYQDLGQSERYRGPKVRWVEGVTIMVAVAIVVIVGSLNDYQKERQFIKLNRKKDDRVVKAIRSGKPLQISVYDVLTGDVLHLEPGDLVPADGVLISGHNIRCDESSVTGESDQKKKIPGDVAIAQTEAETGARKLDPFIISGSKVLEGTGTYLVTCVGVNSNYGKLIMAVTDDADATPTPLQVKLSIMAGQITKFGCTVALLLFTVLFVKFLVQLKNDLSPPAEKVQNFLQIVIVSITIIVIAVPEGLPLAVTLALAFAMTRMLKDNNLVRVLSSCETMGNATAICSDKTGTLTTNKMTVVAGRLGTACKFGALEETVNQNQGNGEQAASGNVISFDGLASFLSTEIRDALVQSIVINSTAFEGEEDGKPAFIGSKTETALLLFAKEHLGMRPVNEERANAKIVQMYPFDSGRKSMATVVRLSKGTYRIFVKGAAEILLDKCTRVIEDAGKPIKSTKLTKGGYNTLANVINKYADKSLRTIGVVYCDFGSWPPPGANTYDDDPRTVIFEDIFKEMVFLGIFGIQDPLRPGVREAVAQCQHAGVFVRMVTGDNIFTAKAIAEECGIYTKGGIVLEGLEFRKLSITQIDKIIPRLQVLARSSPEDKRTLTKRLKDLGETVAVTGDGTNDGPALRAADVGFSMGISGTDVAKEASSIILMDDNFSSIVKALEWGRAVNDAVKKFLQFQLTVNITAVGITFISAIANPNEEPILTPVQLLWVNLIMDTFAALALATDPPTPSILDRKPEPKSAPLITLNMWKMIIGQSIYQLAVTLVLNFAGNDILGYKTMEQTDQLETLIFNIYVWMQIFNQLNNRRLDEKINVFEGIRRNMFFIGINLITIGGQVIIVNFGGSALSTIRLDSTQWAISILLGAFSLPIAVLIRLIPNSFIENFLPANDDNQRLRIRISDDERFEWNDALEDIRKQLTLLKIRRGRLTSLMSNLRDPRDLLPSLSQDSNPEMPNLQANVDAGLADYNWSRSRSNSAVGLVSVMVGMVAGSIGGWSFIGRRTRDGYQPL